MPVGMNDVALITAKSMIPVHETQVAYYKQRIARYENMGYDKPEAPGHFFYKTAVMGLTAAMFDLNYARKVVEEYEQRRQRKAKSTSVQDAEAMVSDQGQSTGPSVSEGEETVPDPDQGPNS